ncbi:MAG: hypothetical protein SGPRY_014933 [Prymnesium sp.]
MASLRLLYCHGLESGPHGHKARWLAEWAGGLTSVDMRVSLANPLPSNSLLRSLGAAIVSRPRREWLASAVGRSLESCAQLQRDAIRDSGPFDALVASSWGAAVALKLLAEGSFCGPAVLLYAHAPSCSSPCPASPHSCPAHRAPERWAGCLETSPLEKATSETGRTVDRVSRLKPELKARCVIVHGTIDPTVPIEDSRELSRQTGIRLIEVEGGSHGLGVIVQDGRLKRFIETVVKGDASHIKP